jgi:hypothetical protein
MDGLLVPKMIPFFSSLTPTMRRTPTTQVKTTDSVAQPDEMPHEPYGCLPAACSACQVTPIPILGSIS